MKNIGLFINSLGYGGAEKVVVRLSEALSSYYNIYIFLINAEKIKYKIQSPIIDLGGSCKRYNIKVINSLFKLKKEIRRKHIECVISFLRIPNLINTMCGINYKKIISIRSFCDQESYRKYLNGRFYFMSKLLESYFYKKADYVVGVSNEQRKSIEEEYGMLKSKIRIIENLYDIKEIERLSKLNIENNVEKFFSTHDVAVYVGRLIKKKGHENLLDIFEKVVAVYERAGLLLLGDGPLMEELIAKSRKLNIENNVLFLGNCNPPYPYMARAKLFVGVSFNEGFPNALMEAMACGIPVMHTACPTGPREILQREYNERKIERVEFTDYGVLMPDLGKLTDLEKEVMEKDIVEVWVEFLKNEELRKQYALLAKKRAGDYSYQRCIERYRNIIEAE